MITNFWTSGLWGFWCKELKLILSNVKVYYLWKTFKWNLDWRRKVYSYGNIWITISKLIIIFTIFWNPCTFRPPIQVTKSKFMKIKTIPQNWSFWLRSWWKKSRLESWRNLITETTIWFNLSFQLLSNQSFDARKQTWNFPNLTVWFKQKTFDWPLDQRIEPCMVAEGECLSFNIKEVHF